MHSAISPGPTGQEEAWRLRWTMESPKVSTAPASWQQVFAVKS
jgi:hypothetical protein